MGVITYSFDVIVSPKGSHGALEHGAVLLQNDLLMSV